MAKIIQREESDARLKEIDKLVKNKFRWNWLERSVTITFRNQKGAIESSSFLLEKFIRKVDKPGSALCITCDKLISYGSKGALALDEHCSKSQKHAEKMSIKMTNASLESFMPTKTSTSDHDKTHYGVHPDLSRQNKSSQSTELPKSLVPMCDRISNSEGMVLGVIAEYSLSLSMAPVLVDLAKTLAQDKAALNSLSIGRHSASYKMIYGLGETFREETIENLQNFPFSINIDESTSSNNKRILAVLVSYFHPNEGTTRVDHLASLEVIRVDSASLFGALDGLFTDLDIPWCNLVSALMDSCSVMRGSKSGVEVKLREKANHLLDIDGDSCHHIHNACKKFCEPFDKWVETLFSDIFSDFKWSSDLKDWLTEVCDILHVKFTVPQRYVSHRWLSVYDVCLSTRMLFESYIVLYYGFLHEKTKPDYKDVVDKVMEERSISKEGTARIFQIHRLLATKWKTLTSDGKQRKTRILEKIFFEATKTKLIMNFYIAALPLLQQYVKVFQSKETLIHQLHDRQLETFQNFLVCFVKPEAIIGLSAKKLKNLNLAEDQGQFLKVSEMFVGADVHNIRKESRRDDPVIGAFSKNASKAYLACAIHMQKKLPIDNPLLRSLSSIDPEAKGHSMTASEMKKLATHVSHFLTPEQQASLHHEVLAYQIDSKLPVYENVGVAKWWSQVHNSRRFPALSKMAGVALSIFHGPQVESSFNLMGDIIDSKSSRLNVETFSAIQTVKYNFLSKKTSALQYFSRPNCKYSPVNRRLCRNLRSAASIHKKVSKQKAEARKTLQEKLKLNKAKTESRLQVKLATEKAIEVAKQKHMEKQKRAARKRALEVLVERSPKKRKLCQ